MNAREAVGVLGGTFDPVHYGHLRIAECVRRALGLSRAVLMVAARPPHKAPDAPGPARDREAMLRLAVRGWEGLALSTLELARGGVSFTIDTLRQMRGGNEAVDPVFMLGWDSLLELPTWNQWERLIEEFDLAVVDRPGAAARQAPDPRVAARLRAVPADPEREPAGAGGRIFHVVLPPIPVSSREIRDLAAAGRGLAGLVPPDVGGYIRRTGLYFRREDER